ncbi:MAG: YgiQ family radical SAM protein [Lachnospiraceae bacterium]|nr:YgiQ family radical SAM protein [Lachnospiraceae bacterium]
MKQGFLPVCAADMQARGIGQFDFIYVIGDAYVDHPSFGHAIISRVLESRGYSVGIISQPDHRDPESIRIYGPPRLGFLVTGGNMDSMVNHYSVSRRRRDRDAYTPGGIMGKRPDYATVVYCNLIRSVYKQTPIIIGGIEASLRRLAHYDYWSNKLKRSILLDSAADLLLYGMGERSIVEVAEALDSGLAVSDLSFLPGTVYKTRRPEDICDPLVLPDFEALKADKRNYAQSFYLQYCNTDPFSGRRLVEGYPDGWYVVQNPPAKPLSQQEMDDIYGLPYMRTCHPSYEALGGVPAIQEVKFSLVSSRGCFGGCSFCALTFHQGRIIQARSHDSILQEAEQFLRDPEFKGYIHDVGGPTANFRQPACSKQTEHGVCPKKQCLFPKPCQSLRADHSDYRQLLQRLRQLPGVKKVFIRSGIRFDYLLADPDPSFLRELCEHHVSGQLKVAPEHISDPVLEKMGKPGARVYEQFARAYRDMNERLGKRQYLVPYLMSSHPGSTLKEAVELAEFLRDLGYMPQQVQDFYPTPSTISTCMYYTGLDPRTMEPVYVAKNPHEKAMQRALIQYRDPKNYDLVEEALTKAGRQDLIGYDRKCLIRPRSGKQAGRQEERTAGRPGKQAKKKTIRNVHKKKKGH